MAGNKSNNNNGKITISTDDWDFGKYEIVDLTTDSFHFSDDSRVPEIFACGN